MSNTNMTTFKGANREGRGRARGPENVEWGGYYTWMNELEIKYTSALRLLQLRGVRTLHIHAQAFGPRWEYNKLQFLI